LNGPQKFSNPIIIGSLQGITGLIMPTVFFKIYSIPRILVAMKDYNLYLRA
jgi:hypothetical protein